MKYLKLYKIFIKNSFIREFSDPLNIIISHIAVLLWMSSIVILYKVIFTHLDTIVGWTWSETLLLIGTFYIVDGIIFTLFYWNFLKLKEYIKKQKLDGILTKPVSSQFVMSTQEIQASMYIQFIVAIVVVILGLSQTEIRVDLMHIGLYLFFLVCASIIAYTVWFLSMCSLFWIPSAENIIQFFEEIFNFAVYPSQIYSGVFKIIFTFIIPLALMVTIPSQILTQEVSHVTLIITFLITILLFILTKIAWHLGLRRYTNI